MSLTTGNQGASVTPAADFYTKVSTALTNAGWSETSDSPVSAAAAGNTGDAVENVTVRVWKNHATHGSATCFIMIVVNESGTAPPRLRFRCSEGFDNVTTHGPIHPVPGASAATSQTPAANDSVTATEDSDNVLIYQASGTTQKVGWTDIRVSAGGFSYVVGANLFELVVATSPAFQNWTHMGVIRAADNYTPDSNICFLGGRSIATGPDITQTNQSWAESASAVSDYKVSRQPNQGAVAIVGGFSAKIESAFPSLGVHLGFGGQPGIGHKWLSGTVAYQAYLHQASNTSAVNNIRSHIAKMSSIVLYAYDTVALVDVMTSVGDTITIDGEVYYILGANCIVGTSGGYQSSCRLVCAKSSRF